MIPKLLDCLGRQVFQQDLLGGPPEIASTASDENRGVSSDALFRAKSNLADKSADAFRALCVGGQDLLIIQALIPNLVAGNRRVLLLLVLKGGRVLAGGLLRAEL